MPIDDQMWYLRRDVHELIPRDRDDFAQLWSPMTIGCAREDLGDRLERVVQVGPGASTEWDYTAICRQVPLVLAVVAVNPIR